MGKWYGGTRTGTEPATSTGGTTGTRPYRAYQRPVPVRRVQEVGLGVEKNSGSRRHQQTRNSNVCTCPLCRPLCRSIRSTAGCTNPLSTATSHGYLGVAADGIMAALKSPVITRADVARTFDVQSLLIATSEAR